MRLLFTAICLLVQLTAQAEPPTIQEMRHENGTVFLTWRHPSCWDFEIIWNGEGVRRVHIEAGRHGLRQFKWRALPRQGTNTVAIRAISETGQPQEWAERSLVLRERARWDGVMPPDPLNPAFRVARMGFRADTLVHTNDLTVTWNYTGPVSPNHVIHVFEAVNLRDWAQVATVPASPAGGMTVPKRPYSFYRAHAVDETTGLVISGLTNLVMDP